MEQVGTTPAKQGASPLNAIIMVIAILSLVAILIVIATLVGVGGFLFAGFLFILYWTGIKEMAPKEFLPALLGSLGGLALAYLLQALPIALGVAGSTIALSGVALSIYLIVRGQLPLFINLAFMLFLTVGASPAIFEADVHYAAAAGSIVLAALYTGGLAVIGRFVASRRAAGQ